MPIFKHFLSVFPLIVSFKKVFSKLKNLEGKKGKKEGFLEISTTLDLVFTFLYGVKIFFATFFLNDERTATIP